MTATEMFARLVGLRNSAGESHYLRIEMADKLLKDRAWVEDEDGGGGDESKALDRLEEDCFGDLCGAMSLVQLLEVFHNVPKVSDWRKHKFNLGKIWSEWQQTQKPKKKANTNGRAAPKELVTPAQFAQQTPAQQRNTYERALRTVESDLARIERLEKENAAIKTENTALKAQLRQMREGIRYLAG